MKVLITGHRGYLGTALVDALVLHGHEVTGLDIDLYHQIKPLPDLSPSLPQRRDIRWVKRDIRETAPGDFEGSEAVIHLAGLSNDPLGALDPANTWAINHKAAVHCAEMAKAAGVARFIFASSCSVYGASDHCLLTEESDLAPVTAYAESKALAERDIALLQGHGFAPVFLRSGTVYGATAMMRFDLVVNNLVAWATASGAIQLTSDGQAWRPIVHVCDVARAFCRMLDAPATLVSGQAFNVAVPGGNMQIIDIANRIEAAMPQASITFSDQADADRRNYKVDGSKLAGVLGDDWWSCEFSASLDGLIAQLGVLNLPADVFEGPGYQRVAYLKEAFVRGELVQDLR